MNMKTFLIVGALITGSSSLFLQVANAQAPAPAGQTAPSEATALFNEALKVGRTNNLANTQQAVDLALAHKGLTQDERAQLLMELARVSLIAKKQPEAIKLYQEARALPGASANVRYNAALAEANILWSIQFTQGFQSRVTYHYFDTYIDQAMHIWKDVLSWPDLTNSQKINLYRLIANGYLEKKDPARAQYVLMDAMKLPNLSAEEADQAKLNYANVLKRQGKDDQARKLYQEIYRSEKLSKQQLKEIAQTLVSMEPDAGKREALREKLGLNNKRSNRSIVEDTATPVNQRWIAYRRLIADLVSSGAWDDVKKLVATYGAGFTEANKGWTFASAMDQRMPIANNPQFQLWVGETAVKDDDNSVFGWQQVKEAANALNRNDLERKAISKLLEVNSKLTPSQRLNYGVELVVLEHGNKADRVLKAVAALLEKSEGLKAKEQMDALLVGAKFAHRRNYEDTARGLYDQYKSLIVQKTKRSLPVTFIPNGPKDISEFLNSEYVKDAKNRGALDRKYSGDVQLLMETDTANVGRVMTQADGKAIRLDTTSGYGSGADLQRQMESATSGEYTFFTASCDEDGVYLFFFVPLDEARVKKIREKTAAIGGFEITLAEGYGMPYSCFIIEGPNNPVIMDGFTTQYNNPNYRVKQMKEKNMDVDFRIVDNGVAMLIYLTWDGFIQLPKNGDKWYMEPIQWEKGGWTWGGSDSVHWRETQGELVFENMTPENRTAIKRRLLQNAKAVWNNELSTRTNGYVDFMMDNRLGDQQFYADVIVPVVEKYTPYVNRITGDMTDADVNDIYDNAYEFLINTRYHLEAMRNQYLLKKHTMNP
jgi:tetratricopeptide (TPR) repeat protein